MPRHPAVPTCPLCGNWHCDVCGWTRIQASRTHSTAHCVRCRQEQPGTFTPVLHYKRAVYEDHVQTWEAQNAEQDHCTFVNALCPNDLCVLPYGHPFTSRHRHITGTVYGSANTTYPEQVHILRTRPDLCTWHKSMHYLAPRGTSEEELIRLGDKLSRRLFPEKVYHR